MKYLFKPRISCFEWSISSPWVARARVLLFATKPSISSRKTLKKSQPLSHIRRMTGSFIFHNGRELLFLRNTAFAWFRNIQMKKARISTFSFAFLELAVRKRMRQVQSKAPWSEYMHLRHRKLPTTWQKSTATSLRKQRKRNNGVKLPKRSSENLIHRPNLSLWDLENMFLPTWPHGMVAPSLELVSGAHHFNSKWSTWKLRPKKVSGGDLLPHEAAN